MLERNFHELSVGNSRAQGETLGDVGREKNERGNKTGSWDGEQRGETSRGRGARSTFKASSLASV